MTDLARHLTVASEQLGSPAEVRQTIAASGVGIDAHAVIRDLQAHDAVVDAYVDAHR